MPDEHLIAEGYAILEDLDNLTRRVKGFIDRAQQKQRRIDELTHATEHMRRQLSAARGERDE